MLLTACLLVAAAAFAALWLTAPRAEVAPAPPVTAPVVLGPGRYRGGRPGPELLRRTYGVPAVRVEQVVPLALPAGRG